MRLKVWSQAYVIKDQDSDIQSQTFWHFQSQNNWEKTKQWHLKSKFCH